MSWPDASEPDVEVAQPDLQRQQLALGLSNAQWTSVVLLVVVIAGRTLTTRVSDRRSPSDMSAATPDGAG